jgi:hypothetical protein
MPDEAAPDMAFPSFPVYPTTCDYSAVDAADVSAEQGPPPLPQEALAAAWVCPECRRNVVGPVVDGWHCVCCGYLHGEPFIVGN